MSSVPNAVAKLLALRLDELYDHKFGGEDDGCFRIKKKDLAVVGQVKALRESTLLKMMAHAHKKYKLVVAPIGDMTSSKVEFSVIKAKKMDAWRLVPTVVSKSFGKKPNDTDDE